MVMDDVDESLHGGLRHKRIADPLLGAHWAPPRAVVLTSGIFDGHSALFRNEAVAVVAERLKEE